MNPVASRFRYSRLLGTALKLALTVIAFWLVLRGVDTTSLSEMLHRQDRLLIVEAALLIMVQVALGALRWRLILAALDPASRGILSRLETFKLYYISVFFNCCLPGTVGGDVVRVWLAKGRQVPLPVSINSVIIDRIIALLALGLLVIATLPLLGRIAGFDAWLPMALGMLAAVAGICSLAPLEQLLSPLKHVRPVHWLLYFIGCLRTMLAHKRAAIFSFFYAVLAHVSYCFAAYVLAKSLAVELTPLQCLTLIPPVMLAITLPVSIGGWGIREAGMVGMLSLAGIAQSGALMLSVQLGVINILISLPAGLLWLAYRRKGAAHE
jgi:glycosyltransferase 2 family protein